MGSGGKSRREGSDSMIVIIIMLIISLFCSIG